MRALCPVLVGNKSDLANDREVSLQEGQHLAQQWGCAFFEASAKTRVNIDEVRAPASAIVLLSTLTVCAVKAFFEAVRKIRVVEGTHAQGYEGGKKPSKKRTSTWKKSNCVLF
jgi:GTPase SAR1 family protein